MKKSLILCLLLSLIMTIGCEFKDDSDDPAPVATKGTLKVTVYYTGTGTVSATNKLYIAASTGTDWTTSLRMPSAIANGTYGSDFLAESSTNNAQMTLQLDPGTYYVVAVWDTDGDMTKSYIFNKDSQYDIYDNKTINTTSPDYTAVTITAGATQTLTMTIDGTKKVPNL